jgi:hypothetical protein
VTKSGAVRFSAAFDLGGRGGPTWQLQLVQPGRGKIGRGVWLWTLRSSLILPF